MRILYKIYRLGHSVICHVLGRVDMLPLCQHKVEWKSYHEESAALFGHRIDQKEKTDGSQPFGQNLLLEQAGEGHTIIVSDTEPVRRTPTHPPKLTQEKELSQESATDCECALFGVKNLSRSAEIVWKVMRPRSGLWYTAQLIQ